MAEGQEGPSIDTAKSTEVEKVWISHPVKDSVREIVGIPEGEPVALMVHVTRASLGYNVLENGFINVSGRGTLASILDNELPDESVGVPSIMMNKIEANGGDVMMITFCVPSRLLKPDTEGKYGYWFDNRLPEGDYPELRAVYDRIIVKYDDVSGKPLQRAKEVPDLYPVLIPKNYILGVATLSPK